MTDIVILSLEDWDDVWRRNQHLAAGLLTSDPSLRVLFVEPSSDPVHAGLSARRPRRGRGLRRGSLRGVDGERLWLFQATKLLPRRINPGADGGWANKVERAAASVGFRSPILWVNDPTGACVLKRTGWRALYDITDDWLAAARTKAEHERLVRQERVLLALCAEVVVCSPGLLKTKQAAGPVTLIRNAVDVDAYRDDLPRPGDLPRGPTAVYAGTIHTDRVDIDLCVATAAAVNELGTLVLVGPAPLSRTDRRRLEAAGVVLTGAKPFMQVPAYLQHADVLVVPHVVDGFTDSLDPIKVYEYRAARRPVVSTPVAGFREDAGRNALTVASGEVFATAVREALSSGAQPVGGADDVPTWADRVAQMREVLSRVAVPET